MNSLNLLQGFPAEKPYKNLWANSKCLTTSRKLENMFRWVTRILTFSVEKNMTLFRDDKSKPIIIFFWGESSNPMVQFHGTQTLPCHVASCHHEVLDYSRQKVDTETMSENSAVGMLWHAWCLPDIPNGPMEIYKPT